MIDSTKGVTFPRGYRAAGVYCGIKKAGLSDLALIVSDREASVAGVFTQNRVRAAPVHWSQQVVAGGRARAIVVNSGNANCLTGEEGERDVQRMAEAVAQRLQVSSTEIVVASTGVIGVPLPMEKVLAGIEAAFRALQAGDDRAAAEAILTTDTHPKRASLEFPTSKGSVRIGGIAKGAGMIAPQMATMLAFLTTDAAIPAPTLQHCLSTAVDRTFNCITVDGDTSTNDMVILLANGASGVTIGEAELPLFQETLTQVCEALAKRIVRDGEGATRFVVIRVEEAADEGSARRVGKTIAESLLVKTAIHGADPNWGRILAAAGRSGVPIKPEQLCLSIQNLLVFEKGRPLPIAGAELADLLLQDQVEITLRLGMGSAKATIWTCDLSAEYVRINSAYRT